LDFGDVRDTSNNANDCALHTTANSNAISAVH
jgi:hypothetical protein